MTEKQNTNEAYYGIDPQTEQIVPLIQHETKEAKLLHALSLRLGDVVTFAEGKKESPTRKVTALVHYEQSGISGECVYIYVSVGKGLSQAYRHDELLSINGMKIK